MALRLQVRPVEAAPVQGVVRRSIGKRPWDPTYVRDKPGKSPMGMDLVPVCRGEAALGGGVRIDPALVQSMGVRIAPAVRRDLSRKVRAVGRVGYDERLVEHVHNQGAGLGGAPVRRV